MPRFITFRRTLPIATLSIAIFSARAELPINYPDWLAEVPGSPADNPELFYLYALGRDAAAANSPLNPDEQPYIVNEGNEALLRLDFKGRQDVAYIFETQANLSENGKWTPLVWKLGPTEWQAVPDQGANIVEQETVLKFDFPTSTARFFRLRAFTDATLLNEAQAVRFLKHATFGPKQSEIDALLASDLDFEAWIDAQIALPPTFHIDTAAQFPPFANFQDDFPIGKRHGKGMLWFEVNLNSPDQLRHRMAWALFQIIVLGEEGSNNNGYLDEWATYYDHYVRHATGNYRDLLQDVTESPKMGRYLTYVNNQKANNSGTRQPDENYAREVMQLFTIGLWELNRDGSLKLDENDEPIPTYDNSDITELARVFTGYIRAPKRDDVEDREGDNWVDPMAVNNNRHDKGEKTLVDGTVLPAGQNTRPDVEQALDVLFNHPNTAPFISIRLIQRITCSNPSPQYIDRVAAVFEDDGNGVRGNLAAVAKAILLDPEARSGSFLIDPTRGKLREPLIRFMHLSRSFDLTSERNDKLLYITDLQKSIGAHPDR
ncbi:MAG: DUF1800 family protein, partial [Verrucomicrobiota bacterium]